MNIIVLYTPSLVHLLPGHDGESEVFGHRLTQSHPQRVRRQDKGSVNASVGRGHLLCQEVVRVTALLITHSLSNTTFC